MPIDGGVNFHARRQTISYRDTADGKICRQELNRRKEDTRGFDTGSRGEVIAGLEAGGDGTWLMESSEALGHRGVVGDATEIRRLAQRRPQGLFWRPRR